MPTIIDQLIVTLSLDPRNFTAGQKAAVASLQQTARQLQTTANSMQKSGGGIVSVIQNIQHPVIALHRTFQQLATTTSRSAPLQTNLTQIAAQGRRSGLGIQSGALAGASGLRILGAAGLGAFAAIEVLRRGMNHAKEAAAGIFTAGVGAAGAGMDIARFTAISQALKTHGDVPQEQTQAWLSSMAQRQFIARTTGVGAEELATSAAYTRSGIRALTDTPEEMMRKMAASFSSLSEKEAVGRGGFLGLSPVQALALRESGRNFTRYVEEAAEITKKQQKAARGVTDASNRMGEAFDKLTRIIDEQLAPGFVRIYDFITRILNIITGNITKEIDPNETTGRGAFIEGLSNAWKWWKGEPQTTPIPPLPKNQSGAIVPKPGTPWDPAKSGFTDPAIAAAAAIIRSAEGSTTDVNNFKYNRPGARWVGPDGVERGSTAGGFYQTLDTNWVKFARELGIDTKKYPRMQGSPQAMQDRVFDAMVRDDIARGGTGFRPWSTAAGGPINAFKLAQIQFAMAKARASGSKLIPTPTEREEWIRSRETGGQLTIEDWLRQHRGNMGAVARANAGGRSTTSSTSNNSSVNTGDIQVYTQATEPLAVGAAVSNAIQRMVSQAKLGLD